MGTIPVDVALKEWIAAAKKETLILIERGVPLGSALEMAVFNVSNRRDDKNADKARR